MNGKIILLVVTLSESFPRKFIEYRDPTASFLTNDQLVTPASLKSVKKKKKKKKDTEN